MQPRIPDAELPGSVPAASALPERPSVQVVHAIRRAGKVPAFWVFVAEIVLAVVFGIASPHHAFLSFDNFSSIGLNSTELILLATGGTFMLAAGELDLSVASNLVLSSVIAAGIIVRVSGTPSQVAAGSYPNEGVAVVLGVLGGLLAGAMFGLVNGLLVTRLKVSSFVVTLGTMGIGTGLGLLVTNGVDVVGLPSSLQDDFGANAVWGVPIPLVVSILVIGGGWLVSGQTRFGLHVLAYGSSRDAARRAGLRSTRIVCYVFILSGLMAGAAGVFDITRFGTTALSGHSTDTLAAIAAVVIGGTSLFGGRASMGGTLVASFLPVELVSGLVMLNVGPFYQNIAIGLILIVAVYLDQRRRASVG